MGDPIPTTERNTKLSVKRKLFEKMEMIFQILTFTAILAMASATKKGDETFVSVLSKERQEMKELFRHENKALRQENAKLQAEDDKLRKRDERLQEQIVQLRDEKLQEEIARLKKENEKLRHVDRRQRDQVDNLELEKKMKDLIRQEDGAAEKKRLESQTNKTSMNAISAVKFTDGSANATSQSSSKYNPEYAFIRGKAQCGWFQGKDPENYGIFPQMVWYDFGHGNAFIPARVTFRGETSKCSPHVTQVPSVWEFIGSNDDACTEAGNWTILCQDLSHEKSQKLSETKFCDVKISDPNVGQRGYRCLGINVLRCHDSICGLSNVRMWKNVIN